MCNPHVYPSGQTYDSWLHRWRHEEEGNGDQFWHSFDYGPAHFVFLSTQHETPRQFQFLEEDLRKANEPERREKVPWVIVVAHHPMYNVNTFSQMNRDGFEPLLAKYRVSLYLCGHCRNYERTKPINQGTVTDWGDGKLDDPYIQAIFPAVEPPATAPEPTRHCKWNGCSGGSLGRLWCNQDAANCQSCGGDWCPYPNGDPEVSNSGEEIRNVEADSDMNLGWGTIHLTVGIGGRHGDQCPALVCTQLPLARPFVR